MHSCVELGELYLELHHRIHRLVDEAMNDAGLSLSRAKVLRVLAQQGPVNQATVAYALGFAPRSVTDTLDALEREGLATRGPDPRDRRAWLVEITPAGTVALDRAIAVKKALMNTIFDGLSDTEREHFADTLAGLRTRLDSKQETAHVS
ncbi:MarR family winged helix-turn-helix transcriptional regulator [uncultured Jatrophihabitans sp.]|uniref:MarR family winged helix-turn-helix transcriptional regulator n=1 Tax=uncultured Jatrophihabitans sp. TaxID=1610747 RepID=UPI0035CBB87C